MITTWSPPDGDTYCPKCGQLEAIIPRHNCCLDCIMWEARLIHAISSIS